jgi:hypothetical protein
MHRTQAALHQFAPLAKVDKDPRRELAGFECVCQRVVWLCREKGGALMMMDARLPWPGMKILIRRTNKFCVAVLAEKKANRSTQFKIEMLARNKSRTSPQPGRTGGSELRTFESCPFTPSAVPSNLEERLGKPFWNRTRKRNCTEHFKATPCFLARGRKCRRQPWPTCALGRFKPDKNASSENRGIFSPLTRCGTSAQWIVRG